MRTIRFTTSLLTALVLVLLYTPELSAQINTDVYFKYLEDHKGMTSADLLKEYPAGMFRSTIPTDLSSVTYLQDINGKYVLTPREMELISKHGFMVTERLTFDTYRQAYYDIYLKDLPIYISSDAILHTVHRSYDNILASLEETVLRPMLDKAHQNMHETLRVSSYSTDPLVQKAVRDADVYLVVARMLLHNSLTDPVFAENAAKISELLTLIDGEAMSSTPLFSETSRNYDFSQFTPRGHYTKKDALKRYFKAMMWHGRTEIYITKPVGADPEPTDEDIRRQCMLAVILGDLTHRSGAEKFISGIDKIISSFVGEQDNLTLTELAGVCNSLGITAPEQLNNDDTWHAFQDAVVASGGDQKILSQLLYGDPFKKNQIKPAAAFMLLGQRFILDSYILGNVVFDKVQHRLMPSPLDAMFVLGNDATIQLLQSELTTYNYALNLAGLRYLTNSLDSTYWNSSLYTTWLSAIRTLNPPANRELLPLYMQTGAWWQKTLNAQLTSWAELRHDNLLYAKQSYTGGLGCFYPKGYVEPVPDLYKTIAGFAERFLGVLTEIPKTSIDPELHWTFEAMGRSLVSIKSINTRLASMAEKELRGESFSADEKAIIDSWIIDKGIGDCTLDYSGYYSQLMYGVGSQGGDDTPDFVVADVHTQPTDESGNMVGKVLHVGTGKINLALVTAVDPSDNCTTAYIGPVGSFFEHVTEKFKRLTDEEWVTLFESQASRPLWVNNYLASKTGEGRGEEWNLLTDVEEEIATESQISVVIAPNPSSATTMIAFSVPPSHSGESVSVTIVNAAGEIVATLMSSQLSAGNYLTTWNGLNTSAQSAPNGAYFARIDVGSVSTTRQLQLVR